MGVQISPWYMGQKPKRCQPVGSVTLITGQTDPIQWLTVVVRLNSSILDR